MTPKAIATVIAPNSSSAPRPMTRCDAHRDGGVEQLVERLNEHLAAPLARRRRVAGVGRRRRRHAVAGVAAEPHLGERAAHRVVQPDGVVHAKGLDEGPPAAAAGVEDNDAQLEWPPPERHMLGPTTSLLRKRKIDLPPGCSRRFSRISAS